MTYTEAFVDFSISDIILFVIYLIFVCYLAIKIRKKQGRFYLNIFVCIAILQMLMTHSYWVFSATNSSDSVRYYIAIMSKKSWGWLDFIGVSENFIRFLNYPFGRFFGVTYWGTMWAFSLSGLFGYYYLLKIGYLQIKRYQVKFVDKKIFYLLLLPSLHFYTCAIGKDSLIFLAIILFLYGLLEKRYFSLLLGASLVGIIRGHILILMMGGVTTAIIFLSKKISIIQKFVILAIAVGGISLVLPYFLHRVRIEDLSLDNLTDTVNRFGGYNQGATTSVDLRDSNIIVKVLSYLFRPFFIDAKGILGIIVSFENIIWMYAIIHISRRFKSILKYGEIKDIFMPILFGFLAILIGLASVMTNLGLTIRQKTQLFPFLFIMYLLCEIVNRCKQITQKSARELKGSYLSQT